MGIPMRLRDPRPLLLVCATFIAACVGQIGTEDEGVGGPGDGPGHGPDGHGDAPLCEVLDPGSSPIRRLTRVEYDNTVRDLLGDTTHPARGFVAEEEANGFDNQAAALNVTQLLAEQYLEAAEALAAKAVEDLPGLTQCADGLADEACAASFIERFGARAFRRPLSDDEKLAYQNLWSAWTAEGQATAIRIVLTAMLQSPHFLYRVELGMPDPVQGGDDVVRLTSHELASRLAYLLWNSMPDEALFAAADAGELDSREQIATQAERMLADPRARDAVSNFHDQWLGLQGIESVTKDLEANPTYDESLRPLWKAETEAFVNHVVFEGDGDLTALFTAPYTMANDKLAAFYGVSGPSGSDLEKVDLDPAQRAGIFTQASLLAVNAQSNQTSPVFRGKFVREKLLCQILPPPPDDIDINPPAVDPSATTRERYAAHASDPACAGCHNLMDPIGFGFENYDAVGLYRTQEGTLPVDASGEVLGADDADGTFVGAVELAKQLAESDTVRQCVVTQWFRFGYGRAEEKKSDGCTLGVLNDAFEASGWKIESLLLALTQTDAFAYRRAVKGGSQ